MVDVIHPAEPSACPAEIAGASRAANTTTKAELLERAKAAVEAGEQSLHDAAEALGLAEEDRSATQREMAEAVGKSASWVNKLLKWRRSGYKDHSPLARLLRGAALSMLNRGLEPPKRAGRAGQSWQSPRTTTTRPQARKGGKPNTRRKKPRPDPLISPFRWTGSRPPSTTGFLRWTATPNMRRSTTRSPRARFRCRVLPDGGWRDISSPDAGTAGGQPLADASVSSTRTAWPRTSARRHRGRNIRQTPTPACKCMRLVGATY